MEKRILFQSMPRLSVFLIRTRLFYLSLLRGFSFGKVLTDTRHDSFMNKDFKNDEENNKKSIQFRSVNFLILDVLLIWERLISSNLVLRGFSLGNCWPTHATTHLPIFPRPRAGDLQPTAGGHPDQGLLPLLLLAMLRMSWCGSSTYSS